jgi:hypothetical protein
MRVTLSDGSVADCGVSYLYCSTDSNIPIAQRLGNLSNKRQQTWEPVVARAWIKVKFRELEYELRVGIQLETSVQMYNLRKSPRPLYNKRQMRSMALKQLKDKWIKGNYIFDFSVEDRKTIFSCLYREPKKRGEKVFKPTQIKEVALLLNNQHKAFEKLPKTRAAIVAQILDNELRKHLAHEEMLMQSVTQDS